MAQYNADIRIGVTGKAQLNQLEAQLKRTQTQLNKLNKSLQLRTRVQAIRLDTRAANTAIKQLEQRINRLGRTINVNLRVNEKGREKEQKQFKHHYFDPSTRGEATGICACSRSSTAKTP